MTFALTFLGCAPTEPSTTTPSDSTTWSTPVVPCESTGPVAEDTGVGVCPTLDLLAAGGVHSAEMCGETTATLPEPSGHEPSVTSRTMSVIGVGRTLGGGSGVIGDLHSCGGSDGPQVRLVDDRGDIWTFGWSAGLGDEPVAGLAVGDPVHVLLQFLIADSSAQVFESAVSLLLSDDRGPLLFYEERAFGREDATLTEVQRGGVAITVLQDETCLEEPWFEHAAVDVSWCGGAARLRSGEVASIAVGDRAMQFALLGAYLNVEGDCHIGCSPQRWLA